MFELEMHFKEEEEELLTLMYAYFVEWDISAKANYIPNVLTNKWRMKTCRLGWSLDPGHQSCSENWTEMPLGVVPHTCSRHEGQRSRTDEHKCVLIWGTLCAIPSSGHRPDNIQGGQSDVLGQWGELCIFRDEVEGWDGPLVFFISCTELKHCFMMGAFLQLLVQ